MIYVEGRNKDFLLVHTPGLQDATVGTMSLDPKGLLTMHGEHHPITEIGLANLCRQLIQRGESAGDPGQVQVKRFRRPASTRGRAACWRSSTRSRSRRSAATWPGSSSTTSGISPSASRSTNCRRTHVKGPQLVEEYTYLDVKLNNGYSDADFDPKNRQYKFP